MNVDVAVIGGGVSGLVVAADLVRRGHSVVVLERQVRAGGKATSERFDGFLMEQGPTSVSAISPAMAACAQTLGLDDQRIELGAGVRRRYLTKGKNIYGIPVHPLGFFVSNYLPLAARLRMLTEFAVRRGDTDQEETVASFFGRRFGTVFADRVVEPLVGGIFAGAADALSINEAFPRLVAMEQRYGSLTRGVLHSVSKGRRMPGRRLFCWRDGMGALPAALTARLGPVLKTGIAVRRIVPTPQGFSIGLGAAGAVVARTVVIATQPHVAASLLDGVDAEAADAAASIDAPPLAVVFLGYRREQIAHPLDGLGYLTAPDEGRAVNGALFCSTMFAHRAPEGHVALTAYIGGARAPELARLDAGALIATVRAEFEALLGARGAPVVARVRHWMRSLPQYHLGHGNVVASLRALEQRRRGMFLTGNYFRGVSVVACMDEAAETADRVDVYLRNAVASASAPTPQNRSSGF